MIIDNLNDVRAKWSAISDQVMGGISEVNFYEIEENGEKFYKRDIYILLIIVVALFQLRIPVPSVQNPMGSFVGIFSLLPSVLR